MTPYEALFGRKPYGGPLFQIPEGTDISPANDLVKEMVKAHKDNKQIILEWHVHLVSHFLEVHRLVDKATESQVATYEKNNLVSIYEVGDTVLVKNYRSLQKAKSKKRDKSEEDHFRCKIVAVGYTFSLYRVELPTGKMLRASVSSLTSITQTNEHKRPKTRAHCLR